MSKARDDSTDRATSTDVEFYLPGMPSSSLEHSRAARLLARFFRRRGVLPADSLLAAEPSADSRRRAD